MGGLCHPHSTVCLFEQCFIGPSIQLKQAMLRDLYWSTMLRLRKPARPTYGGRHDGSSRAGAHFFSTTYLQATPHDNFAASKRRPTPDASDSVQHAQQRLLCHQQAVSILESRARHVHEACGPPQAGDALCLLSVCNGARTCACETGRSTGYFACVKTLTNTDTIVLPAGSDA